MSSQPSQSPKPIIKRCPACGSRVAAEQKVCPICGHEFHTTKPVPILPPASSPASAPSQPNPLTQPPSSPTSQTSPTPATSSTSSSGTAASEAAPAAPQPAAKFSTQPIKPAQTGTRPQSPLPPNEPKSTIRPIKPLTRPQAPVESARGSTRPITQPVKPATKPTTASPSEDRGAADRSTVDGRRATGASRAIKPVTMVLNAPQRRIPWGLIGVMAVVVGILVVAFLLMQNSGFLSPTGANPASATTESPALTNFDITPNPQQEQLPAAAPANADGQAVAGATEAVAGVTEAPTPTPILVTATPVPPQEYTIVSGDTCGTIAEKFGISLAEFLTANSLSEANCTRIRIGDKLTIPAPVPTAGPSPTPQPLGAQSGDASAPAATLPPELVYEVQSGDVCGKIVQKFPSVTIDQIVQQNNLDANCTIQVGQKLVLKFSSAQATATGLPQVAVTPTPRTGYAAPQLVSPQEGAVLTDTQATLKLQWLSAGLLKENEYYVVQVQATGAVTAPVWETKATSLDIAQDLVGAATEQEFTWFVSVKQKLATDPKTNAPIYNDLSPISQQRQFVWRRQQGTVTPTP